MIVVHSGFGDDYDSIRDNLWNLVTMARLKYPEYSLHFTGHSLGGALATLASLEAVYSLKYDNVTIVTFGSPRVGGVMFAYTWNTLLSSRSLRLVHEFDLVPHLPPSKIGFSHVGMEVWQHKGHIEKCRESIEDPSCSYSVPFIEGVVSDHFEYIGIKFNCTSVPKELLE